MELHRYIYFGIYENFERRWLARFINKGDQVVDVGSNIGYYSAYFSNLVGPTGSVHSFEPSPTCQQDWLNILLASPGAHNIRFHAIAIGKEDKNNAVYLESKTIVSYGFGVLQNDAVYEKAAYDSHNVKLLTLDSYAASIKVNAFSAIKIDVEGTENDVIAGMRHMLRQPRKPVILTEVHLNTYSKNAFSEYAEILLSSGYKVYHPLRKLREIDAFNIPINTRINALWLPDGKQPS